MNSGADSCRHHLVSARRFAAGRDVRNGGLAVVGMSDYYVGPHEHGPFHPRGSPSSS